MINKNILYILFFVGGIIFFASCGSQPSQNGTESQNQVSEQPSNSEQQNSEQQDSNQQDNSGQVFSEIKGNLDLSREVKESRSASDWDMFPVSVTEQPKGNGWKNVQVQIGFSNQKSLTVLEVPNGLTSILHQIKLNTDGGYSYDADILSLGGERQLGLADDAAYPPGLKIKGYNSGKGGYSCPAPDSSKYDLATLEFEVGETLKLESLSFPNGKTVDINTPEPDYPGKVPDVWLTAIGDEVETNAGLVVSLKSVKKDADKITFEFEGKNSNPGKDVESGYLNVYILGNDGIVYQICYSSQFGNVDEVGPGQTITFGGDVMFPENVRGQYAVATMNFLRSGKEIVAFVKMDN